MANDFTVQPLTGYLGAEISGINLAKPLDDGSYQELRQLWLEHKVLFFRRQEMSPEEHIEFASHFGEVQKPGFVPTLKEYPQIKRQEYDQYSQIGSDITWHADDTFNEVPSRCSVLYALDVPEAGGDTVWVNMEAVYESFSEPMKNFLQNLIAVHDLVDTMGPGILKMHGPEHWQKFRDSTPPVEHPVVRTHPETGNKSLFVNPLMTSRIKDMTEAESRNLLDFLYEQTNQPEFQCRFHWEKNSVAFWDNRCLQHKGINDFFPNHRLMHRVAIADDQRPI